MTKVPGPLLARITRMPWPAEAAAAVIPASPSPITSMSNRLPVMAYHLAPVMEVVRGAEELFAEIELLRLLAIRNPCLAFPAIVQIGCQQLRSFTGRPLVVLITGQHRLVA